MSYSPEKLIAAKNAYRVAIEEATVGLLVLELLEQLDGQITGEEFATRLLARGIVDRDVSPIELCEELEITADEPIELTDDVLEFGLKELL